MLMRILFSSCADNFEIFMSDLLYEIYLAKPETLKSNAQVTVKEVLDCTDMQEFISHYAKSKLTKASVRQRKGLHLGQQADKVHLCLVIGAWNGRRRENDQSD